jgi:hypothetical protein
MRFRWLWIARIPKQSRLESEIAWTEFAVVANAMLRATSNYTVIMKIN